MEDKDVFVLITDIHQVPQVYYKGDCDKNSRSSVFQMQQPKAMMFCSFTNEVLRKKKLIMYNVTEAH